jgi:hypothetical protein
MLLVYETYDASLRGIKLLVYEALRYQCMRPCATSVCGLKLLADEASSSINLTSEILQLIVYEDEATSL